MPSRIHALTAASSQVLLAVLQELKTLPWLKKTPCLIIGRHPQAPREVPVVCKQITGSLLLGNVRDELRIKPNLPQDPSVLSPSDFEAAAGCSKGKNWKVCTACCMLQCCTALLWSRHQGGGRGERGREPSQHITTEGYNCHCGLHSALDGCHESSAMHS